MSNPFPMDPELRVVSEPIAAQLLAQASELDQLHASGSAVADLRAAATEAGIAAPAFDAALAEMQDRRAAPASRDRQRRRARLVMVTAM